jgi:hypothetical protein
MVQNLNYYLHIRFTDSFIEEFSNHARRNVKHEHYVSNGAILITKYIETFKQSGIINVNDCDEECLLFLEYFKFESEVVKGVKMLSNNKASNGLAVNNFEKVEQLEKNLVLLSQVNERKFNLSLDRIRSFLKNEVTAEKVDMNNIIIDLYSAFTKADKGWKEEIFKKLAGYWGTKREVSDTVGLGNIPEFRNAIDRLNMLFETRIELKKHYNHLQDFKIKMKKHITPFLIPLSKHFLQRDKKWSELKSYADVKAYEKEFEQNLNFSEEIKFLYRIIANKQNKNEEEEELTVELGELDNKFFEVAKKLKLQSIIYYSNTSRNNSLKYLVANFTMFIEKIRTIYDLVMGRVSLNNPQNSSDRHELEKKYFDKKFQYLKSETKAHISLMKNLRGDVLRTPPTKDLKDTQLKALTDESDIIHKCVAEPGLVETAWKEFSNTKVNSEFTTEDYDVKVLRDKLFSLYQANFRADSASRLNDIKSGLDTANDKYNYLVKVIDDVEENIKFEIKSGNNNDYEIELLTDLSITLQQFETLYKTSLKLIPNDILLREISNFNVDTFNGNNYGARISKEEHDKPVELVELFYNNDDFKGVRRIINEFQLMFVKYQLAFYSDSDLESKSRLLSHVRDIRFEVKLSNFNLLIFSEIEKGLKASKY